MLPSLQTGRDGPSEHFCLFRLIETLGANGSTTSTTEERVRATRLAGIGEYSVARCRQAHSYCITCTVWIDTPQKKLVCYTLQIKKRLTNSKKPYSVGHSL
jgi:hypothetical protein